MQPGARKLKWPAGWMPVWTDDMKKIGDHFGRSPGRERAPAIKAVYLACCQLAKDHGFDSFTVNIALVASLASTGYKTTAKALKELETIGLLKIEAVTPDGLDAPRRYTVLRTVGITERSPIGLTDQLPTCLYSKTVEHITPPPPADGLDSVTASRIRSIRDAHPSFERVPDSALAKMLTAYPGVDLDEPLEAFTRHCAGADLKTPVREFEKYLKHRKNGDKKHEHDSKRNAKRSREYPEHIRVPILGA